MRRWWVWCLCAVLVLGAAYWTWPLVGAAQLAAIVRRGDPAEIAAATDLPALQRSFSRQIARAYLKVTGKADRLGAIGRGVAGAAVTTVADPYVAEILTPENIKALLSQGHISHVQIGDRDVAVKATGDMPKISGLLDSNLLSIVTGSYFDGLTDFVIPVDGGAGAQGVYGIHLRLRGLTWKLAGLDLPPPIVEDLARSLIQKEGQAAL